MSTATLRRNMLYPSSRHETERLRSTQSPAKSTGVDENAVFLRTSLSRRRVYKYRNYFRTDDEHSITSMNNCSYFAGLLRHDVSLESLKRLLFSEKNSNTTSDKEIPKKVGGGGMVNGMRREVDTRCKRDARSHGLLKHYPVTS